MLREVRILKKSDLKNMCIKNKFFTCGNNDEYNNMLNLFDEVKNINTQKIIDIAFSIFCASNTEHGVLDICNLIAKECNTFFVE